MNLKQWKQKQAYMHMKSLNILCNEYKGLYSQGHPLALGC